MPTAHADVSIDRASRYLVQLCEHLNQMRGHARHGATTRSNGPLQVRRVEWTDQHGVIEFPAARCTLDATEDTLTVTLVADEPDELRRMQDLFANRLQTIGRRDNLAIAWVQQTV